MFAPKQFREKASEYGELVKTSNGLAQKRGFRKLEQSFTALADNEQWLADNHQNTIHADEQVLPVGAKLAEEEHILRCLGAALILQWNTLPATLQRELFDSAGSVGDLLKTTDLRAQVARFLHKHKNDQEHKNDEA